MTKQTETGSMDWMEWASEFAVDVDGSIWAFEDGCLWDGDRWVPNDEFDGMRYEYIGDMSMTVTKEDCAKLHWYADPKEDREATEDAETMGIALSEIPVT